MLLKVIETQAELEKEPEKSAARVTAERRLKALEQEIELRKEAKAQSYTEYRAGRLSKEGFLEKKSNLQKEILEKQRKLEELRGMLKKQETDKNEWTESFGEDTQTDRWNRELIERLVDVIWVYDTDRVKVNLKYREKSLFLT